MEGMNKLSTTYYNIYVTVKYFNFDNIFEFGNNNCSMFLELKFSGAIDAGHYDIMNYNNNGTSLLL